MVEAAIQVPETTSQRMTSGCSFVVLVVRENPVVGSRGSHSTHPSTSDAQLATSDTLLVASMRPSDTPIIP